MQFRIADTFTDSLGRLNGQEQKAVKTTAFDLQLDPAHPGMRFHRINNARDSNFWSVRVSRDIRLIVHKTTASLLLCYVDHHDKAYQWAERRRIETHPSTGAAQIVEVRETVEEKTVPKYFESEELLRAAPPLFAAVGDESLLAYGVPSEWLEGVREVRDEDGLFALAEHLPSEAGEALLELAVGGTPATRLAADPDTDPFDHPDAQRRFRVVHGRGALQAALDYPWDRWSIFLHPAQQDLVTREFNGPARVAGSAGTGKTIVALHRAVSLARRSDEARVLLTTFNDMLATALRQKLNRLVAHEPELAERIDVKAIDRVCLGLYARRDGALDAVTEAFLSDLLAQSSRTLGITEFSHRFLIAEWHEVVDAWQLHTWDDYRDIKRLGRKTRLPEAKRKDLWRVFEHVRASLAAQNVTTLASIYAHVTGSLQSRRHAIYDYIVVDEAQDISVPQLRFLAAMAASNRSDALFFAGDLGQRIFQTPFSWKSLGIDVRGRSKTLKINYRTSHQIRRSADRLLDPSIEDVDGNADDRAGTTSLFDGPEPVVQAYEDEANEIAAVAEWLRRRQAASCAEPREFAVIVRTEAEFHRARRAIEAAGLECQEMNSQDPLRPNAIVLVTMHSAKGLEFRAVAIMACDDHIVPLQSRLAAVGDHADLSEIYETERHLLYVACTRARDSLIITAVEPASEFVEDLA